MNIVTLDFETAYSTEYSLTRMSTRDYVTDPRFQIIGCALKVGREPARWVPAEKVEAIIGAIDWSTTGMLCHNARFDYTVLQQSFGVKPAFIFDTMAMAQATIFPKTGSASLAKCADHFGLPPKGTEVVMARGKWLNHFTPQELQAYAEYSMHDAELCRDIFDRIMELYEFPHDELVIIDSLVRMYSEPILELDPNVLAIHLHQVKESKQQLLEAAGLTDRRTLMSNKLFAEKLRGFGVDIPTKTSPTTGKQTFAFAKTDPGMKDLLDHENPSVQVAVAARLGHKSTLEETRTQRFLAIAQRHGTLHVPLKYSGAHTHRLSGDEKLNLQNLTRGSELRRAIRAPEGYKLVVADSSQIEARMVAWLAGQEDLLDQFRAGEDVYATFASSVYGYPVTKATHQGARFVGKTGILGLGYQCGAERFYDMLKAAKEAPPDITPEFAANVVGIYREKYTAIKGFWYRCRDVIPHIAGEVTTPFGRRGVLETGPFHVKLPNGLELSYHNLHQDGNNDWRYDHGRRKGRKLYGGSLTENVTQALARIAVMDVAVLMRKTHPEWRFVLQVHDELIYCVPKAEADHCLEMLLYMMARSPRWAPELPLAAEGGVGNTYGDVK